MFKSGLALLAECPLSALTRELVETKEFDLFSSARSLPAEWPMSDVMSFESERVPQRSSGFVASGRMLHACRLFAPCPRDGSIADGPADLARSTAKGVGGFHELNFLCRQMALWAGFVRALSIAVRI